MQELSKARLVKREQTGELSAEGERVEATGRASEGLSGRFESSSVQRGLGRLLAEIRRGSDDLSVERLAQVEPSCAWT